MDVGLQASGVPGVRVKSTIKTESRKRGKSLDLWKKSAGHCRGQKLFSVTKKKKGRHRKMEKERETKPEHREKT